MGECAHGPQTPARRNIDCLKQCLQRARGNSTGAMLLLASRVRNSVSETTTPLRLGVDPRFTDRERQPGLDLLRALAIVVVVIYHAALFGFKLPGRADRFGWIGVDLFFVLSGYLIFSRLVACGRGPVLSAAAADTNSR